MNKIKKIIKHLLRFFPTFKLYIIYLNFSSIFNKDTKTPLNLAEEFSFFYKKKKLKSEQYPFSIHDPRLLLGVGSGYDNFTLVGDNWLVDEDYKPIAILWGFNDWKYGFTADYLPEYRVAFAPRKFAGYYIARALSILKIKPSAFIVWGYTESRFLHRSASRGNIPIFRMEDGFIRSAMLGASHATPYSLILDKTGMSYDCSAPSDIENILNEYDFKNDKVLLKDNQAQEQTTHK